MSPSKVTATEVAVAQFVLEDLEVDVDMDVVLVELDVLLEVVAAAVELVVADVVVSCWYKSLN